MVTITCPWCEEDALLQVGESEEPEPDFVCADCGTSITLAPDQPAALDLAA